VTHVLVDPLNYAMMTPVLRAHSDLFHPVFDQDHWAVYEVTG
jgi:hypothetical protein